MKEKFKMNINHIDTIIIENQIQFIKILEAISNSNFYKKNIHELGKQHGIAHVQRVLLFSQIIAQIENLDKKSNNILLVSAAFHDCGRIKDRDNGEHGVVSSKIVGEYFSKNFNNLYGVNIDEIGIIQTAIEYHTVTEKIAGEVDEIKLKELCNKYDVSNNQYEKVKKISAILKDADALDRMRFIYGNNLNPCFLRTSTAKRKEIIEFAKKINNEFAREIININYFEFQNISDDKVALLHYIRQKLKKENKIFFENEKDVPLDMVMSIFKVEKNRQIPER